MDLGSDSASDSACDTVKANKQNKQNKQTSTHPSPRLVLSTAPTHPHHQPPLVAPTSAMSSFFSGLRSALTRATSYGSQTSAQSPHEVSEDDVQAAALTARPTARLTVPPKTSTPTSRSASPVKRDPFVDEDSFIGLDASQIALFEDDTSRAASSRTLSLDETESLTPQQQSHTHISYPAVTLATPKPKQPHNASTPQTIFQTAQKDVFRSAFKSAQKERDVFMTAKPIRTWTANSLDEHDVVSPSLAEDSSVTLSFDQTSTTPSIGSKRDCEDDQDHGHDNQHAVPSKRRRSNPISRPQGKDLVLRHADVAQLDTTNLSDQDEDDEEMSGFSSSEWSLESPPPGLDRKARRNWKRQQRRSRATFVEQAYGVKKSRSAAKDRKGARTGFRRSVSGREVLLSQARRRFWEAGLAKDIYCC